MHITYLYFCFNISLKKYKIHFPCMAQAFRLVHNIFYQLILCNILWISNDTFSLLFFHSLNTLSLFKRRANFAILSNFQEFYETLILSSYLIGI